MAQTREASPGMSDAAVQKATGRSWKEWFQILDRAGASGWSHKQTATWLAEHHPISGWWAQSVTVGYERARGKRATHQKQDGTFAASASKTLPVSVARAYALFANARSRKGWLPIEVEVTSQTAGKYWRGRGPGGTRISAGFTAKAPAKCSVQVQIERIGRKSEVSRVAAEWKAALGTLAAKLAP